MTDQEKEVIDHLVNAHNAYLKLPIQHNEDIREWVPKLHDLQRIIMAREAVRNDRDFINECGHSKT